MSGSISFRKDMFELTCDRSDWVVEYASEHSRRLLDGIGFFHLHEWLESRGISATHRVCFRGVLKSHRWLMALALFYLYPLNKQQGTARLYYDGHL